MSERSRKIADAIATKIMANTRKRFSSIPADALSDVEKEIIQMSKEVHATGEPTNGAPATRGQSFTEATGKNMNADADQSSSCPVQVSIPAPQRGADLTGSARLSVTMPEQKGPRE